MGPLANPRRINAMESLIKDAQEKGAKVATGGKRIGNQGNFFEPTVLDRRAGERPHHDTRSRSARSR